MRQKLIDWPKSVVFIPFGIVIAAIGLLGLLDAEVSCGEQSMSRDDRCVQHADDDGESILAAEHLASLPQRPPGVELSPGVEEVYADIASVPEWAGRSFDEQRDRNTHNHRVIVILGVVTTALGVISVYVKKWWLRRKA
ncbi:hypothetical protein O4158_03995 [Gordonia amicalis]|uniref:hypothetical protein n=1 Tax=Gordonia amicalis TaxID=89053 RepID=UPI0022B3A8E7|nr:hypothetical protein [Gordonia amicalis]MCZ4578270.1 hypothetical protein [Gordonia amicalis]